MTDGLILQLNTYVFVRQHYLSHSYSLFLNFLQKLFIRQTRFMHHAIMIKTVQVDPPLRVKRIYVDAWIFFVFFLRLPFFIVYTITLLNIFKHSDMCLLIRSIYLFHIFINIFDC